MDSNHEIQIINVKPEETIPHSILILKGCITTTDSSVKCEKDYIHLILNSSTTENDNNYKLINNKFKILLELIQGKNVINLNYCCVVKEFIINYEPLSTPYTVLPLYIICEGHDGKFQAPSTENNDIQNACQRIMLGSKLLQAITAEKFYEEKLGRKTFYLESDCQLFHSKLSVTKARQMKQEDLWRELAWEIMESMFCTKTRKFIGFLSCTNYCGENYRETMTSHEEILQLTQAYVAQGAGGFALFGTACLFTWPENLEEVLKRIEDATIVDKHQFMDDSCYRGTYGACFSTTLGSVLHELCHTFDLGHTETGIMGRGFDDITKVLTVNSLGEGSSEISKVFQSNIEFKEKLDSSTKLSERLENKPKEYCVKIDKMIEGSDDTFWPRCCLMLLNYHKWFNNHSTPNRGFQFQFDPVTRFATSTTGLRVIEIRNEITEMVLKYWIFDGRVLKYFFQIPENVFVPLNPDKKVIVIEDNIGNILKMCLPPSY